MSTEATIQTVMRLSREEGMRLQPYDDATGKIIGAPQGNLSWGIGFNLMTCGSPGLFQAMLMYLLGQIESQLSQLTWYSGLPDAIQSVCQDIAYNAGVHGLMNFPHMISALAKRDYAAAAIECTVADPHLDASRYAPLRALILDAPHAVVA
jgi:GH24 family phage-related lysozyme (muramidase)